MTAPHIAERGPFMVEVEAGRKFFCGCKHSKGQPFCDGTHKGL